MTTKMKLELEQSTAKESLLKLVAIPHADRTDEQTGEMETLTARLQSIEPEIRAALTLEGLEQSQALGQLSDVATPEQSEIRGLLQRVQIGDYLSPALGGVGLTGVPAELNSALSIETAGADGSVPIPWVALLGTEQRALAYSGRMWPRILVCGSQKFPLAETRSRF